MYYLFHVLDSTDGTVTSMMENNITIETSSTSTSATHTHVVDTNTSQATEGGEDFSFLDTLNLPDQVGPPPKKAKKDEIEN